MVGLGTITVAGKDELGQPFRRKIETSTPVSDMGVPVLATVNVYDDAGNLIEASSKRQATVSAKAAMLWPDKFTPVQAGKPTATAARA